MDPTMDVINEQLLIQLECPICLETCTANIYMCKNGHTVCAECVKQLTMCSVCRAAGKPSGRCKPLEQIAKLVRLPCNYKQHGCPLSFTQTNMAAHLTKCDYGLECLICNDWRGSVGDLRNHVAQAHTPFFIILPPNGIKTLKCIDLNHELVRVMCMFVYNDKCFWYESVHSDFILSSTMRLVSHDEAQASLYYFAVEYVCKIEKLKVLFQNKVLSLTAHAEQSATNIMLPKDIVRRTATAEVFNRITIAL